MKDSKMLLRSSDSFKRPSGPDIYASSSDHSNESQTVQAISLASGRTSQPVYRLYKRRFVGLTGLVLLNLVGAMAPVWFGAISNDMAKEFGITLDEVNWLGNVAGLVFLPTALFVPHLISKHGIRRCCYIGSIALILSAWIRFSGTARSLSRNGAYTLLLIGQILASVAQPMFQVVGPKYSETWFGLQGRTTATMIVAISNPVGGGIGQLLSPIVGDTRKSILVLGILGTVVAPGLFLVGSNPPTPPTYAGSKPSPPFKSLGRAMLGMSTTPEAYMTIRERIDFAIVTFIFGVLVASTSTFSILSAQIMQPMGYSSDESGFMGATLLLSGIVAAIVTAPLFDRVFTHHLAFTSKFFVSIIGVLWLSLVWAVKPNNTAALFAIMALLGICTITMLPIGLELGCELTRNADGSSAVVWFLGNLLGVVFVLVEGALRGGQNASPPLNMHRALIFTGSWTMVAAGSVFFLKGAQKRRAIDEDKNKLAARVVEETLP